MSSYARTQQWEASAKDLQQWMGPGTDKTVNLAMYTFRVGPWLPVGSVISADLTHKPE